jgi:hypothetical protein
MLQLLRVYYKQKQQYGGRLTDKEMQHDTGLLNVFIYLLPPFDIVF